MLTKLITLGIALLCLAYYVRSKWPGIKDRPMILSFLIGGMVIFLVGVLLDCSNLGSTLRLLGTCVFFTGVAIDTAKVNKKDNEHKS